MRLMKSVQQLRTAYNHGARWCVMVSYESPSLGSRGDIVSTHRTYDLARAAARRSGWDDHLSIQELHAEACGQAA